MKMTITRITPTAAPATLINTVFVTLFFEFVGPEDELPKESNSKHIEDIPCHDALCHARPLLQRSSHDSRSGLRAPLPSFPRFFNLSREIG